MNINTNVNAQRITGLFRQNALDLSRTYGQLSSGSRINSAADDAAGLQISNRITSEINGMKVAIRNANDAISMMQTMEGAVTETTHILNRMRDIAIQSANATNTTADRKALNEEVVQLKNELNRINDTTTFAGRRTFDDAIESRVAGESDPQTTALKTWLPEAEDRVSQYLGIDAKALPMAVTFSTGGGSTLASVSASVFDANGRATSLTLDINTDAITFDPNTLPNSDDTGGGAYADRIIAHEMVHAAQFVNWDVPTMQANGNTWFLEGTAELIHGADYRLGNKANIMGVDLSAAWPGTSDAYGASYLAARYMHDRIKAGGGTGIDEIMTRLATGNGGNPMTLDQALADEGTFADTATFLADYDANKSAFYDSDIDLTNADTGAIGGADMDGGAVLSAEDVLPNAISDNEYSTFIEDLPVLSDTQGVGNEEYVFQIGAYSNQTLGVRNNSFNTTSMGIEDLDVLTAANSQRAITEIDSALAFVDYNRGVYGAVMNRLDSTVNNLSNIVENQTAARSRMADTDFAQMTAELTRQQILQQSSISLLSQANQTQQLALSLLNA